MGNTDELAESYERSGFGKQLEAGASAAILVVDVCQAYAVESSPLFADCQSAFDACASLIATARSRDVPVVWTRVSYQPGGVDGGLFYRKIAALASFDQGNPLAEWIPGLEPAPREVVITKQYASAFFASSLASTLNANGIDTLLICGVSTSGCVRASAVDALQHGFVPLVVTDACGDRDQGVHDANLFDLGAKYAQLIDLDAALAMLQST